MPSRIFLLGFMGSGKSTLGPFVADCLGYEFVDLDETIRLRYEKPITALFNELGEAGFREIETEELRRAADSDRTVVGAGGGVVTVAENRELIRTRGLSLYLRLPAEELARRLKRSRARPMLFGPDGKTLSGPDLVGRIKDLIAARAPLYEAADVVVDLDGGPVARSVDRIVKAIYSSAKSSI